METFVIRDEKDWEKVKRRMNGEKEKKEFKIEIRIPEISIFKTDEEYKQFKRETKIYEKLWKEGLKWEKKVRKLEKKGKDVKGGGFEEALEILNQIAEKSEIRERGEVERESLLDYME